MQLLGPDGQPLITTRTPNLRRWAHTQLGPGERPAPAPGRRPALDLRPLACTLRFARSSSGFHQRLLFERWMAPLVPLSKRRDLRPPAYLHLDLAERFPRVSVRVPEGLVDGASLHGLYGPFRDRRAAERALKPLHKRFALRPCDYVFEPQPQLPLGENCLYAQVRSCSAPCLARVSEAEYQALAARLATFLAQPAARPADFAEFVPACVSLAAGRTVIVERTRSGLELYPCLDGAVFEDQRQEVPASADQPALLVALERLVWPAAAAPRPDDRAWLAAHLQASGDKTVSLALRAHGSLVSLAAHLHAWR